jgi:hypothetical protein
VSRLSNWVGLAIAVLVFASQGVTHAAVPAAENLLPNSTKGFLSVGSVEQLKESWNKTQLGQLIQDPLMKPFVEDFRQQLQHKWAQTHR